MVRLVVVVLLVGVAAGVRAEDEALERLRAENARLEARVRELEAENAALKGRVGSVDAKAERSVTTSVDEDTDRTSLDMEPSRLELTGGNRSRHWISLHAESGDAQIGIEAAASNGVYRRADRLELSLDGTPLPLTGAELRVLEALMRAAGRVLARATLVERALSSEDASERTVDVHVARLRRKLGDAAGVRIVTVYGAGYRLDVTP